MSIKELARRTGLSRNTIRRARRAEKSPSYKRAPGTTKLEPFKAESHRPLKAEPAMPGARGASTQSSTAFSGSRS